MTSQLKDCTLRSHRSENHNSSQVVSILNAARTPVFKNTINRRYNGPEYNGKNLAVYTCELLEQL
jgi:hypothetical protein